MIESNNLIKIYGSTFRVREKEKEQEQGEKKVKIIAPASKP